MRTKRDDIQDAIRNNDFKGALRIAKTFRPSKNENDLRAIQDGWDAIQHFNLYKQINKNPQEIIDNAIALLKQKFIIISDEK